MVCVRLTLLLYLSTTSHKKKNFFELKTQSQFTIINTNTKLVLLPISLVYTERMRYRIYCLFATVKTYGNDVCKYQMFVLNGIPLFIDDATIYIYRLHCL